MFFISAVMKIAEMREYGIIQALKISKVDYGQGVKIKLCPKIQFLLLFPLIMTG
jgi:hypothetical protein